MKGCLNERKSNKTRIVPSSCPKSSSWRRCASVLCSLSCCFLILFLSAFFWRGMPYSRETTILLTQCKRLSLQCLVRVLSRDTSITNKNYWEQLDRKLKLCKTVEVLEYLLWYLQGVNLCKYTWVWAQSKNILSRYRLRVVWSTAKRLSFELYQNTHKDTKGQVRRSEDL